MRECDVLHIYVRLRVGVHAHSEHISKVRLGGFNQVACLRSGRRVSPDNQVRVG